jgi:hypothetical protein
MKTSLLVSTLAKCALLGAGILLAANQFIPAEMHPYLSSFPLALAGLGYTLLQVYLKPPRLLFLKRLVLAAAFLLWALVQLLSPGRLAVFLGDAVIAAYVLDLFWIMQAQGQSEVMLPDPRQQSLPKQDQAYRDQTRMNIQHELAGVHAPIDDSPKEYSQQHTGQ